MTRLHDGFRSSERERYGIRARASTGRGRARWRRSVRGPLCSTARLRGSLRPRVAAGALALAPRSEILTCQRGTAGASYHWNGWFSVFNCVPLFLRWGARLSFATRVWWPRFVVFVTLLSNCSYLKDEPRQDLDNFLAPSSAYWTLQGAGSPGHPGPGPQLRRGLGYAAPTRAVLVRLSRAWSASPF